MVVPEHGTLIDGGKIDAVTGEKLRLMSVSPAAVAELEARLLARYGQTEPERPGQP